MERRKRRATQHKQLDNTRSFREEVEPEPTVEFLEEELIPVNIKIEEKPQQSLSLAVPNMYDVRDILKKCWIKETAYQKSIKSEGQYRPSRGQCYVTALLIQELFGGEIIMGLAKPDEEHYWNKINGVEIDFTSDQYGGDGYHPIVLKGVVAKGNKSNKRFKLLKKRWEELCRKEKALQMMF